MADVMKLLIAAMERHITWDPNTSSSEVVIHEGHEAETLTTYRFTIDADIHGGSVLYVPSSSKDTPPDMWVYPKGREYNGTIRRGEYTVRGGQTDEWSFSEVVDMAPAMFRMERDVFEDYVNAGLFSRTSFSSEDAEADGDCVLVSGLSTLRVVLSKYPNEWWRLSLIDVLALAAAEDARNAGRIEDAKELEALVPAFDFPAYTQDFSEVFDHIAEPKPLLIRGGGKQFTAAMGADTRPKGRTKRNTESGIQYTRAGADNGLIIAAIESGQTLIADAGTNKLLCHIGSVIMRDNVKVDGGTATIHTSIGDILTERGLEPTRKNKERVRAQIQAVMLHSWRWEDKDGTQHMATVSGGEVTIKRGGDVDMVLSKPFMHLVMNHGAGIVPIDPVLLTTDDSRYQSAFAIGYRLASHTFMNADKPSKYRLSVSSLLSHAKAIPTAEEIEASDRGHQTSRIVGPLERSLDYLVELGYLRYWDYCHANGEPLTDAEQDARFDADGNEAPLPYDIARNCLITWEPVHAYVGALQAATDARGRNKARALEAKAVQEAAEQRIERLTEREIAKRRARLAQ